MHWVFFLWDTNTIDDLQYFSAQKTLKSDFPTHFTLSFFQNELNDCDFSAKLCQVLLVVLLTSTVHIVTSGIEMELKLLKGKDN